MILHISTSTVSLRLSIEGRMGVDSTKSAWRLGGKNEDFFKELRDDKEIYGKIPVLG